MAVAKKPPPEVRRKMITEQLLEKSKEAICGEIKKSPQTILDDLKEKIKKSTPGAKDSK